MTQPPPQPRPKPTVVIFRKYPEQDGGEVVACFPDLDYVYTHIGQHSNAAYRCVYSNTKPAKPEEYGPLLRELTEMGYDNLLICRRWRRK